MNIARTTPVLYGACAAV